MTMSALEVPEASRTVSFHTFAGSRYVVVASAIPARPRWVATLTGAEAAVLALVAAGMRTGDIARERGCGTSTVVKQLAALREKTRSADRAELASVGRWYARDGGSAEERPTTLGGRAALRAAVDARGSRRSLTLREARGMWGELLDGRWVFVEQRDERGRRCSCCARRRVRRGGCRGASGRWSGYPGGGVEQGDRAGSWGCRRRRCRCASGGCCGGWGWRAAGARGGGGDAEGGGVRRGGWGREDGDWTNDHGFACMHPRTVPRKR